MDDLRALDTNRLREFLAWISSRTYEHTAGNGAHITRRSKPSCAWPYFRALRRFFNWAVEEGYLDTSPLAGIHFKPPPQPRIEPYTPDAIKRLLAVCERDIRTGGRFVGLRNRAMILVFLDTGLRRSEVANIKLTDLNLDARRISVIGKGNKPGIVPFCSKTAKVLWAYLAEREARAKCSRLWVTEEGHPFTADGMDSWFTRLKQRGGVTETGCLHKMRHTAALQYLRAAKDSFLLQLYLRHESLEMSRRYTRGLKAEEAIEAHRNGASPVESLGLN